MNRVVNFAHRGASGYCPENTMEAFEHALQLGATGIETDVQLTKDGKLVLIHDENLKRTAGSDRMVQELTAKELRQLDAGSWFGEEFQGAHIPLLEELLDLASQNSVILNLELKNSMIPYDGMEELVIEAVRSRGLEEQVVISSFNHYSLVRCHQLAPEIRTGILYIEGLYRPWDYALSLGATALHAYSKAVQPEWVREAAVSGLVYHPWTVNQEEEMKSLLQAGVAGIITDYPDKLARLQGIHQV
ncbi:glycerophosphodiester phosphodiesterase [Paenibacillus sp. JX-17]|uniref:Glycerophosphodiester phosphodiesterase n=1 Tax=Paenibacillus lacisoli TaxID=3064525 RepID=A0ABT9CG32_9BACL|nr:glycerophosphodiester phosphodiesterase [Paenibacillus sp. JX-17]MDO7908205.1 glycerophosphodiester phosphodiesterase [Paenibacillus sp. JX-17]